LFVVLRHTFFAGLLANFNNAFRRSGGFTWGLHARFLAHLLAHFTLGLTRHFTRHFTRCFTGYFTHGFPRRFSYDFSWHFALALTWRFSWHFSWRFTQLLRGGCNRCDGCLRDGLRYGANLTLFAS
jgi:hypothetical protein